MRTSLFLAALLTVFIFSTASAQQSFTNANFITIPPSGSASLYPSSIVVSGLSGTIPTTPGNVEVKLNGFNHDFPNDVGVVLVGPNGAALLLQSSVGGGNSVSNITYTISDRGPNDLPDATQLSNGFTYRPANYSVPNFTSPGPGTLYNMPGPSGGGTSNFSLTFGNINPNGAWSLYIADFSPGASGQITGGWTLTIKNGSDAPNDFDGDGRTDISVFRPSNGTWYVNRSTLGFHAEQFGTSGDRPVASDYDNDNKTDIAVFRPSNGTWYLNQSALGFSAIQYGANGDIPVQGDADGDGDSDLRVYRPSNFVWYTRIVVGAIPFGQTNDFPVVGDFNGNARVDFVMFRPSNGTWHIQSGDASTYSHTFFGTNGDTPAPGDYDGDGKSDVCVFRPSNGTWYRLNSTTGQFVLVQFGQSGDIPVPGDYDGDGRTDIAVFRPTTGVWYLLRSTLGFTFIQFGQLGDIPGSRQ